MSKEKFCSYCDHTGIIHEPHHEQLGESPLSPCPKCVLPECRCGGEEPYFISENGIIRHCPCRETRLQIVHINRLYHDSGIEKKFRWKFLADFRATNRQANEAKKAAFELVNSFPDVSRGLYFWGNPGTGKTLLSSIILTELITRKGVPGQLLKISRNFFQRLKASFVEGSATYGTSSQIERELAEIDVLVVDDFGVQKNTEWEQETLYNLVDARYEAERFTIFTSNSNPVTTFKELSQGRILSRIREMCRIMELSGEDQREKV
jgi:DNA replication protein DnaC